LLGNGNGTSLSASRKSTARETNRRVENNTSCPRHGRRGRVLADMWEKGYISSLQLPFPDEDENTHEPY
jgi:hypothetical protein